MRLRRGVFVGLASLLVAAAGATAAELDVLPTGFVRRYPGLWEPAIE